MHSEIVFKMFHLYFMKGIVKMCEVSKIYTENIHYSIKFRVILFPKLTVLNA